MFWNYSETTLKLLWNCSETVLQIVFVLGCWLAERVDSKKESKKKKQKKKQKRNKKDGIVIEKVCRV